MLWALNPDLAGHDGNLLLQPGPPSLRVATWSIVPGRYQKLLPERLETAAREYYHSAKRTRIVVWNYWRGGVSVSA